jgi:type IV pilus assembly protein PilX
MTALPRNSQRGAILVVALFMLLLLTIIGLSSMRGTALQ